MHIKPLLEIDEIDFRSPSFEIRGGKNLELFQLLQGERVAIGVTNQEGKLTFWGNTRIQKPQDGCCWR